MGGQKPVGTIFSEAVGQLRENYFQHVGVSGIFTAVYFVAASLYYVFVLAVYFIAILAMMIPTITLGAAGLDVAGGYGGRAAAAVLSTIVIVLVAAAVISFFFILLSMVVSTVTGTAQAGVQKSVLTLVRGEKLAWQGVWDNFKANWKRYLGISAWTCLWTTLWSLLFVVPGVVKTFSYMLAPYLIIEYPDMTARQALKKSIEITSGHRGKLFLIWLIQIGFLLAASVLSSFGIIFAHYAAMIVWVYPLFYAMLTIAYLDIKKAAVGRGLLPPDRLPPADEAALTAERAS